MAERPDAELVTMQADACKKAMKHFEEALKESKEVSDWMGSVDQSKLSLAQLRLQVTSNAVSTLCVARPARHQNGNPESVFGAIERIIK